jgi:hypothetical protein
MHRLFHARHESFIRKTKLNFASFALLYFGMQPEQQRFKILNSQNRLAVINS